MCFDRNANGRGHPGRCGNVCRCCGTLLLSRGGRRAGLLFLLLQLLLDLVENYASLVTALNLALIDAHLLEELLPLRRDVTVLEGIQ